VVSLSTGRHRKVQNIDMFPDSKEFSGEDKKNPKNKNQIITKKAGRGQRTRFPGREARGAQGSPKPV
jgi:hypothetical protein